MHTKYFSFFYIYEMCRIVTHIRKVFFLGPVIIYTSLELTSRGCFCVDKRVIYYIKTNEPKSSSD